MSHEIRVVNKTRKPVFTGYARLVKMEDRTRNIGPDEYKSVTREIKLKVV